MGGGAAHILYTNSWMLVATITRNAPSLQLLVLSDTTYPASLRTKVCNSVASCGALHCCIGLLTTSKHSVDDWLFGISSRSPAGSSTLAWDGSSAWLLRSSAPRSCCTYIGGGIRGDGSSSRQRNTHTHTGTYIHSLYTCIPTRESCMHWSGYRLVSPDRC